MIKAVVFDFDGTIMDTETVAYEAFRSVFREHELELPLALWAQAIGTLNGPFDPYRELETGTGRPVDRKAVDAKFNDYYYGAVHHVPLLPGVIDALEEAKHLGLRVGLATSSYREWIEPHLQRHGLLKYFDAIHTADEVDKVKPDPALYKRALASFGLEGTEAVAVEDSLNGLRAAKGAGLYGIVVPNPMTASMNFAEADLVVPSLDGQKLAMLIAHLEAQAEERR
ncbi:HAD family hydrolase [Cohnella nanjingensis]|uniref:HAD family hydrolase n=1 Tax=Cohnella nanjingensis TaxID=1387779 RepID=A0A7X0RQS8_9BACL|nr:HAD family hydrolase [Cohnella nanjingensis]MBB6671773.1 HAD family hydrolase [Cohnella nanjingensis]